MPPEITAVIREIEAQRADLLSGIGIQTAFERMASRAAEAVYAAAIAQARVAELEAEVAALKEPKPDGG